MNGEARKDRRSLLRWTFGGILLVGVIVNLVVWLRPLGWPPRTAKYEYPTYTAAQVVAGEKLYLTTCSSCHGAVGQGDAAAEVPALDASMHAWHHADGLFARYIREGGVYMPPAAPEWSDEQVTEVLAYIKQWWEPRQRDYQHQVSRANP